VQEAFDGYADAGLKAMVQSDQLMKEKKLKEPLSVAMENLFPESYGSHPDELINLVQGSRERMAQKLVQRGLSEEEAKKKEEIKSVMKDIERHRIVTDYDKILNYLRAHNKAKILEMANALHVERTQIMEHVKTLEDSGLIEIVYPPIGAPIVVYKKAKETEEG